MANLSVPTGKDIFIEINGHKVAAVQSCSTKTIRTMQSIESFGSETPVATVGGTQNYLIELKKVVLLQNNILKQQDLYTLSDFTVMIVKPDCRIVFAGCEWESIGEQISLSSPCIETMQLTAKKRMVI